MTFAAYFEQLHHPMRTDRLPMTSIYCYQYTKHRHRPLSIFPTARAICCRSEWKRLLLFMYTKCASWQFLTCGARRMNSSSLSIANICPFSGNTNSLLTIESSLNCLIVDVIHSWTCCSVHCCGSGEIFNALHVACTSCLACWRARQMTGSMSPCCVKPPKSDSSASGFKLCLRWKDVSCRNSRNTWWSCCFWSRLSNKYLISIAFSLQFGLKTAWFAYDCSSNCSTL